MDFICCNKIISKFEVWILKDIPNFYSRKLVIANCPKCRKLQLALIEKREKDKKVFVNKIADKNVSKVLLNEKNRLLCRYFDVKDDSFGWIYGVNKEIKNKNGKITQIRQYASDFNGNKTLIKKVKI